MLALEQVTGFFMVELVGIPLDQGKVRAIVIGVSAHAFLTGTSGNVIGAVQAFFGGDARPDVGVATDALELWLTAADFMAIGAVHGTIEELMLAGQGAGRDLGRGRGRQQPEKGKREKQ